MASQVFEVYKAGILTGDIDSVSTTADKRLRCMLVMTSTTASSANDGITALTGLTVDQHDASIESNAFASYKNADTHIKTITCEVTESGTVKYLAGNTSASGAVTWTAVVAGTRAIKGCLLFQHTNDSASASTTPAGIPVAFFEFSSPVTANGGNITVTFASSRMISLT